MSRERVPTGVAGFDLMIEGGLPRGSLLLVAGRPGTGKTIFSAKFLYHGAASRGENGLYVGFAENREDFYKNMGEFGFDFKRLEREGRFKFLDMIAMKEKGVSQALELIVKETVETNAKRLVIDSFSAMAQAFEKPIDVRIIVHTVLSRIIRMKRCTTLMIVEAPLGEGRLGFGVEEFVADGIIILRRSLVDNMLLREIDIKKLRGCRVFYPTSAFTLENGFQVFPPASVEGFETVMRKYEVIPHRGNVFSSGIQDLDKYVKRLFTRGCYNLLEIENGLACLETWTQILRPMVCNFINQGYGVVILPTANLTAHQLLKVTQPIVDHKFLQNLKIAEHIIEDEKVVEDSIITLNGKSIEADMDKLWSARSSLMDDLGKPVLSVVGFDTLEYTYGAKAALSILGEDILRTRNFGNLQLNIIRPAIHLSEQLRALADVHIKIREINGAHFIEGIKPKTPLLNIRYPIGEGFPRVKLVPIV